MDEVTLKINGKIYGGWIDVDIKQSIKAASGGFALSITDRWSGQDAPWIIAPGDEAQLYIGKDLIITGYVDTVSPAMDKSSRSISISGRDKTCDIIDCSVETTKPEFINFTLLTLAKKLCEPYGIPVTALGNTTGPAIEVMKVQQGESVFECIERAARKRGYLLTSDRKGGLYITRPGTDRATTRLEQGKNILSGAGTFDGKSRYSKYTVKGQESDFGGHVTDVALAYSIKAISTDPAVKRFRPLVIQAEQLTNQNDARLRANWEAAVRAARAYKFTVSVQGWRQGDGSLWRPNQLVLCVSPWIGLSGELLITDVNYKKSSDGGTITTMNLERKDAYLPQPEVPEKLDPLLMQIKKDPGFVKQNPVGKSVL